MKENRKMKQKKLRDCAGVGSIFLHRRSQRNWVMGARARAQLSQPVGLDRASPGNFRDPTRNLAESKYFT